MKIEAISRSVSVLGAFRGQGERVGFVGGFFVFFVFVPERVGVGVGGSEWEFSLGGCVGGSLGVPCGGRACEVPC